RVLRRQRRVAVEPRDHVGDVPVDVVRDGAGELAACPGELQLRMDALASPDLGTRREDARLARDAVISAPAVPDQPAADVVVEADEEIAGRRAGQAPAQLLGERRLDALVGVELEDPVAGAGGDAGVAPVAFDGPCPLDDLRAEALGDGARAVAAAVEYDDDLV